MDIPKMVEYGVLNDFYGSLLTPYQSRILHLYYDLDSSLSELAQDFAISRQGIRNVIVRASKKLLEYEEKLGLVKKREVIIKSVELLINDCDNIKNDIIKEKLFEIKKQVEEI